MNAEDVRSMPCAAAVCYACGCMGRSDEMHYFDHGDDTKGWVCACCQEIDKEAVREMCARFDKVRAEVKAAEGQNLGTNTLGIAKKKD